MVIFKCILLYHVFSNPIPELFKWFKDFVGYKESNATTSNATSASAAGAAAALALAAANDHKTPSGASGAAASSTGTNDFVSPQRERYVFYIYSISYGC